jgi:hypothetical protein
MEVEEGKILAAYCHFDGYPSHNGKILLESYTDSEKIKTLISLGGFSSLEMDIDKIEFYASEPDEGLEIELYINEKDYLKRCGMIDYLYLWKNKKWYVSSKKQFVELTKSKIVQYD